MANLKFASTKRCFPNVTHVAIPDFVQSLFQYQVLENPVLVCMSHQTVLLSHRIYRYVQCGYRIGILGPKMCLRVIWSWFSNFKTTQLLILFFYKMNIQSLVPYSNSNLHLESLNDRKCIPKWLCITLRSVTHTLI